MLLRNILGGLPITSALPSVVGGVVGGVVESVVGEPTVELDYGTFKGNSLPLGVDSFLGMPFAKAARLENPRLVNAKQDKLEGTQDATKYGDACPQSQFTSLSSNTKVCFISRQQSSETILTFASGERTLTSAGADCLLTDWQPRRRLPEHQCTNTSRCQFDLWSPGDALDSRRWLRTRFVCSTWCRNDTSSRLALSRSKYRAAICRDEATYDICLRQPPP